MSSIGKPIEVVLYEQATRNTALYVVRKQRELDEAKASLAQMVNNLERYYARHSEGVCYGHA